MKRVGILRGGMGDDYRFSLKRGGEVLGHIYEHLSPEWTALDILIDKAGVWHLRGAPILPAQLMHQVDVVWNEAHSSFAHTLRQVAIPHISAPHFGHGIAQSRDILREHIKNMQISGIKIPRGIILPLWQGDIDGEWDKYLIKKAKDAHDKIPPPWIVRPLGRKDVASHTANTFSELVRALDDIMAHSESAVVEELIAGEEVSAHSVPGFRGQSRYVFPLGNANEEDKLQQIISDLYDRLGAKHYLKSDFVLSPRRGVYLLNLEFWPDFAADSSFTKACEGVGAKPHHVIEHMLESTLSLRV